MLLLVSHYPDILITFCMHAFENYVQSIGSVHPSESGTIDEFQGEKGEKGESQLDEKRNVFNTFNQLLTCRIDIYSPFRPLLLT